MFIPSRKNHVKLFSKHPDWIYWEILINIRFRAVWKQVMKNRLMSQNRSRLDFNPSSWLQKQPKKVFCGLFEIIHYSRLCWQYSRSGSSYGTSYGGYRATSRSGYGGGGYAVAPILPSYSPPLSSYSSPSYSSPIPSYAPPITSYSSPVSSYSSVYSSPVRSGGGYSSGGSYGGSLSGYGGSAGIVSGGSLGYGGSSGGIFGGDSAVFSDPYRYRSKAKAARARTVMKMRQARVAWTKDGIHDSTTENVL